MEVICLLYVNLDLFVLGNNLNMFCSWIKTPFPDQNLKEDIFIGELYWMSYTFFFYYFLSFHSKFFLMLNQANHQFTTNIQRRIYGHSTNVAIRPLNEEKAVQAAADLVGELFVFSVMLYHNLCPCCNYGQRLTILSNNKCLYDSGLGVSFRGWMLLVAGYWCHNLSYGSCCVVADII